MGDTKYEGWISVYSSGTDYEADLVRHRLDNAGIPAVVLTQRDHAFNLTIVAAFATVHVMVPPEHEANARKILSAEPFTDKELTEAALDADPDAPDAHTEEERPMLDTGIEAIRFGKPDDNDKEV